MTDAEKAALEWLQERATNSLFTGRRNARLIQDMLAEPRLPAEPSEEIVGALLKVLPLNSLEPRRVYRALRVHLTAKPIDHLEEIRRYGT